MFGGSSVLPWICSLGTGLLVRSLIIRLSFVPSFCDQSHSGTNEREQAASPRWSGWLVGWFRRHSRPWSSVYPPLSMSRSRRGRPSSCVTVTSVGAETFSKIKVALSRLPFLTPPSIAVAPSFSIVVQSSPSSPSSSCLRMPFLAASSTPSIAS